MFYILIHFNNQQINYLKPSPPRAFSNYCLVCTLSLFSILLMFMIMMNNLFLLLKNTKLVCANPQLI